MTDKQIQEAAIEIGRKGHDAILDEIIDNHLKILTRQPFTSSVQYFCESGKCSGNFRTALKKMLDFYGKICEDSMQSQSQWIPVGERLPEDHVRVIIFDEYTKMFPIAIGYCRSSHDKKWINTDIQRQEFVNVTHWQPLPRPPKTDKP